MRNNLKMGALNISKSFGNNGPYVEAIKSLDIEMWEGEFVSLVGPSGCGKSTLLNILAGVLEPTKGKIFFDNEEVNDTRGLVGYMTQKDLLLPWRTVIQNTILGLEVKGIDKKSAIKEALDIINIFGLKGFENSLPSALSGGMRQRAALMRTMLLNTDVILLDEPFASLDALTRQKMHEWLLEIWGEFKRTILFITHDVDEAVFLADRVLVMSQRPSKIIYEKEVNLPRPRNYDIVVNDEFVHIKQAILKKLHNETEKNEQIEDCQEVEV